MNDRLLKEWSLVYTHWHPEDQPLREALCTLGNGYFATRGAAEEVTAGGVHYPGTYLAGGYNRLTSTIKSERLENEDLVNWPNWLCLSFRPSGGEWFDLQQVEILQFHQELRVRTGEFIRTLRFRDPAGRVFALTSRRLVSMADPHLAALTWEFTAENWSGWLEIRSGLDGTVRNAGVQRYRELKGQHLEILNTNHPYEAIISLTVQTNQSYIRMAQAARTLVFEEDQPVASERDTRHEAGKVMQHLRFHCAQHKPIRIEKVVAVFTSRDQAITDPTLEAETLVSRASPYAALYVSHQRAWRHLWDRAEMTLGGADSDAQLILRLHEFHLLQTSSMHSIDRDLGIPSRGWHGEAYRGHILWDELFIFPFLNLRIPELTRSLLMYRYRRLGEARHAAQVAGYAGAMFPWQSGSNGREESQKLHLNPRSGRWVPDETHRQRHVNAAIAYNIWQYYLASGDREFLAAFGAELFLEIVRFWASLAHWNPERQRYEIHGVMGPDEFHTRYPNAAHGGLNNNAYTNLMVAWLMHIAPQMLDQLAEDRQHELAEDLQLQSNERSIWEAMSRQMYIPFHGDGIISQFEGYESLAEFPWEEYRQKYHTIRRLDRLLEAEGDDANRYKAAKQADVLMIFYLFSQAELKALFERLGYSFDKAMAKRNVEYYGRRTAHGSTLSSVVHSWVLARVDQAHAWDLFWSALHSDLDDLQGGTTPEGIHLGAMAGTVDLMQRAFTGLEIRDDCLLFDPRLPEQLSELRLRLRYRSHWLRVGLTQQNLTVKFEHGPSPAIRIGCRDEVREMAPGEETRFVVG